VSSIGPPGGFDSGVVRTVKLFKKRYNKCYHRLKGLTMVLTDDGEEVRARIGVKEAPDPVLCPGN
jgi:hypothetical protein